MSEAAAPDAGGVDVPVDINAIVAKYEASLTAPDVGGATAGITPVAAAPAAPAPAAPEAPAAPAAPASSALAQAAALAAGIAPQAPAAPAAPSVEEPTARGAKLSALARLEMEARESKEKYEALLREQQSAPKPAAAPPSIDALRELFDIDPRAALAQLGYSDSSQIATRLMAEHLGADAPPELRQQMADRRRDAELAALKRRVEKRDAEAGDVHQKALYAARVEATDRELQRFTQAVPADMPFLAAQSRDNRQEVYDALCTVAAAHVRTGRWPDSRECAQAVEDQLKANYERLSKAITPQAPPPAAPLAPAASPNRPMETLSEADTRGRPGLGDQPTPEQLIDSNYWTQRAIAKGRSLGLF